MFEEKDVVPVEKTLEALLGNMLKVTSMLLFESNNFDNLTICMLFGGQLSLKKQKLRISFQSACRYGINTSVTWK